MSYQKTCHKNIFAHYELYTDILFISCPWFNAINNGMLEQRGGRRCRALLSNEYIITCLRHKHLSEIYHIYIIATLRNKKKFWWNLWVTNGRPRHGHFFFKFGNLVKKHIVNFTGVAAVLTPTYGSTRLTLCLLRGEPHGIYWSLRGNHPVLILISYQCTFWKYYDGWLAP